jgi:hypothetical protein
MGRGLSHVQRTALVLASEQENIILAELLQRVYGWESGHMLRWWSGEPIRHNFHPSAIGERRYQNERVAARCSLVRLCQRGLLEAGWWRSSYKLTADGWAWLGANMPEGFPPETIKAGKAELAAKCEAREAECRRVLAEPMSPAVTAFFRSHGLL